MLVTVEIPDALVGQVLPAGADAGRYALECVAACAYCERRLTGRQVGEMLGFPLPAQLDDFLREHGLYEYTDAMIEEEMRLNDRLSARLNEGSGYTK